MPTLVSVAFVLIPSMLSLLFVPVVIEVVVSFAISDMVGGAIYRLNSVRGLCIM